MQKKKKNFVSNKVEEKNSAHYQYFNMSMPVIFDEFGRPYIIMREQSKKERLHGIPALKVSIIKARVSVYQQHFSVPYFSC